ncbi:MAG TPA: hypothetical protein VFM93_01375 [Candidatus Limnocylindria bacterium]|nr:hypothetical protein [Candidatus Limnocylindria bacterium]
MLRSDGTVECPECGMPQFPYAREGRTVSIECANRHHGSAVVRDDVVILRVVDNWIMRRGAQLHEQHERWGTDDLPERSRGG